MKKLAFLFLLVISCFYTQAQINLVKNGGFEQRDTCAWAADQIKIANYWSCIDSNYVSSLAPYGGDPHCSPECVNTCGVYGGGVSAPYSPRFFQYPRNGSGMAHVLMYTDESYPELIVYQRDYLQGHLSSTLTAGQSYCVTFYVVRDNWGDYSVDHIGAYFDDGSMDTASECGHPQTSHMPQILSTVIISDTLNWIKIQGSFVANGMERFITIGNFFDMAHTAHSSAINHIGYYLVDDISVIATGAAAYAGTDVTIMSGATTAIGATSNGDGMPCYWYIAGNPSPIDSGGTILVHPTDTTTYLVAMDLCGVITYDTVTVNVIPCTAIPAASFTDTGSHIVGFTYTGTTTSVDSIRWYFGDGSTSTLTDPVHGYTATGTYSVCVTVYTNCSSDTYCRGISVICPVPSASFTYTGTPTANFTYTGTTGADSVVWHFGDGAKSNATDPSHTYTATGTYTVCVTAYTGCGNDTACNTVTALTTNYNAPYVLPNIKVYPNPANDELNIAGVPQSTSYRLLNVTGSCVLEGDLKTGSNTIPIRQFTPGVYILEITDAYGKRDMVRVIKE